VRRLLLIVLGSAILFSACSSAAQTATPTPTPTPTPTTTPTPTPTPVPTPSPTVVPADAGWIVLAPAGDGFTAKFPGTPKLTTTTTTTKEGPAPTSVWEYLASKDLDYNVAMWKYPAGSATGIAASAIYDSGLAGMESTNGLTLNTQSDITLNGHVGRAFTLKGATYSLQGELVLVGDNLYMATGSYAPTVDTAGVTAFLADFQLTV
jgi:hypothetical protein